MLVGWVVFVPAMIVLGGVAGGELHNNFDLPGSEAQEASDLLEAGGFRGQAGETGQIVIGSDEGVERAEVQGAVDDLIAAVRDDVPDVEVVSPYDNPRAQISEDGTVAYADVQFGTTDLDEAIALAEDIRAVYDDFDPPAGVEIELGGGLFIEEVEFSSEGIGFLAAMIILLIAFGSVLAMGLPLLVAIFGIVCGLMIVNLATHVLDIPDFAPSAVAMIGIGVGIDYALLIVTRYREELGAGREPEGAVVRALSTAGRSVLFAGTTVVLAMLSLLVFPTAVTQSLAVVISAGVLMVMLASLTLLPALLGFAGRSIDRLSIHRKSHVARSGEASLWYRWSRIVQRYPWPAALGGLVVLLVLAIPVFSMRLGFGDTGNRPETDTTRRAYDMLSNGFGPGFNGPLFIAVDLPADQGEAEDVLGRLTTALDDDRNVDLVLPPFVNDDGSVALVQAFPKTSPQDKRTTDLVHRLRDDVVPAATEGSDVEVHVGGAPAGVVDFADFQSSRLPLFIGAVLVLSFLLLMAVFRSLLVPLKAVVMNLLSIGAAYGVIVAVFQWGWGADALGLGEEGPIEAWAPMMLFAIVFGLSMDYEVFLLSRIKEEYGRTGDNRPPDPTLPPLAAAPSSPLRNSRAVADGLARTARLITAAAAIMICVFAGFMLSVERSLQLFGMGLAVAVLIDATIVRLILVPATMELLGDRNWWIPRWLDNRLPRIDVEGADPEEERPEIETVAHR